MRSSGRRCSSTAPILYTAKRFLPLARRRFRTSRPFFVLMRTRKPCVRLRRRLLGWNVRFMDLLYLLTETSHSNERFPGRQCCDPTAFMGDSPSRSRCGRLRVLISRAPPKENLSWSSAKDFHNCGKRCGKSGRLARHSLKTPVFAPVFPMAKVVRGLNWRVIPRGHSLHLRKPGVNNRRKLGETPRTDVFHGFSDPDHPLETGHGSHHASDRKSVV